MYVTPSCVHMECLFFLCDVYYGLLMENFYSSRQFSFYSKWLGVLSPLHSSTCSYSWVLMQWGMPVDFSTKQPCIPGISLIWYDAKYSVCSWIWFTNTRFRILVSDFGRHSPCLWRSAAHVGYINPVKWAGELSSFPVLALIAIF